MEINGNLFERMTIAAANDTWFKKREYGTSNDFKSAGIR